MQIQMKPSTQSPEEYIFVLKKVKAEPHTENQAQNQPPKEYNLWTSKLSYWTAGIGLFALLLVRQIHGYDGNEILFFISMSLIFIGLVIHCLQMVFK